MQQLLKTHIKRNYSFKNYLKNLLSQIFKLLKKLMYKKKLLSQVLILKNIR